MTPSLHVIDPGCLTTVQDLGRAGAQSQGVPVSGALDTTALRAVNMVVDNAPDTAALEIMAQGPVIDVRADAVRVAVAGAGVVLEIETPHGARTVSALRAVTVHRGDRLRVRALPRSAVAYLSVAGGLAIPPVLGSRSTYVRAGLGGLSGRALRAGDAVPLRLAAPPPGSDRFGPALDLEPPAVLRVMIEPATCGFAAEAIARLLESAYAVSPSADRMGLRLAGPPPMPESSASLLSEGIAPGAIQVPADGQPILLLADRQTVGGYPRIAHVISADLPAAGRLRPGHSVRFTRVSQDAARDARRALDAALDLFARSLKADDASAAINVAALASQNLVSGVVSGDDP